MRIIPVLVLAGWCGWASIASAASVGDLGDPAKLEVTGADQLGADEVRRAVRQDWPLQVASAPSNELNEYLELLEKRLTRGYRNWGFPDANVKASVPAAGNQIRLDVKEGPRFLRGEIEIAGDDAIDAAALRRALTEQRTPGNFSVAVNDLGVIVASTTPLDEAAAEVSWPTGEPVSFDPFAERKLAGAIRRALAEQARPIADFRTELRRGDDGTVTLVLAIDRAGPEATLAKLDFRGLQRNEKEDVAAALGLEAGQRMDAKAVAEIYRRAWRTGRFVQHQVSLHPLNDGKGGTRLQIDFIEQAEVPPLATPLNESQEAALRTARWLEDHADKGIVLVGKWANGELRYAIDERRMALRVRNRPTEEQVEGLPEALANAEVDAVIAIEADHAWAYDFTKQRRVRVPWRHARVLLDFGLRGDPAEPERRGTFSFAMGLASSDFGGPPLRARIGIDPVCLLATVCSPGHEATVVDGVLTVSDGKPKLVADATTGELQRLRLSESEEEADVFITADPGAVADLTKDVAEGNEVAIPAEQTLSSLVSWVVDVVLSRLSEEEQEGFANRELLARGLTRLTMGLIVEPFVEQITQVRLEREDLSIPQDADVLLQRGPMALLLGALPWTDNVWQRGSWPWALSRALLMRYAGLGEGGRYEFGRLLPEIGPMACWSVATYLQPVDRGLARFFASEGLKRLDAAWLAKDFVPLLEGEFLQPTAARRFLEALQTMPADEAKAVSAYLKGRVEMDLAALRLALLDDAGKPLPIDASNVAEACFPLIEAELRRQLEAMAGAEGTPRAPGS